MRRFGWLWAIGLALLIAACGGENETPNTATNPPAPPTATAPGEPVAPATWTPAPTEELAGEDLSNADAEQALPATWTPRAQVAPPTTGPTLPPPPPPPTRTPLPDWCLAFQAISAPDASFTQHPVHIRWVALENAAQYHVELHNGAGMLVTNETIGASEYMFAGDLFERQGVYGWQVTPLDESGALVCFSISNEIVVRDAPM